MSVSVSSSSNSRQISGFAKWYAETNYPYMDVVANPPYTYLTASGQSDWIVTITEVREDMWVVRRSKFEPFEKEEHVVELFTTDADADADAAFSRIYYNPYAGEMCELKRAFPEYYHMLNFHHMYLTEDKEQEQLSWTISHQNQLDWHTTLDRSSGIWIVRGSKEETQEEVFEVYDVPMEMTEWKSVWPLRAV